MASKILVDKKSGLPVHCHIQAGQRIVSVPMGACDCGNDACDIHEGLNQDQPISACIKLLGWEFVAPVMMYYKCGHEIGEFLPGDGMAEFQDTDCIECFKVKEPEAYKKIHDEVSRFMIEKPWDKNEMPWNKSE